MPWGHLGHLGDTSGGSFVGCGHARPPLHTPLVLALLLGWLVWGAFSLLYPTAGVLAPAPFFLRAHTHARVRAREHTHTHTHTHNHSCCAAIQQSQPCPQLTSFACVECRLHALRMLGMLRAVQGLQLVVDNTFTPCILSPIRWGADVVVHSLTKFISGASDIIAGGC
jgi:hypothetical protein